MIGVIAVIMHGSMAHQFTSSKHLHSAQVPLSPLTVQTFIPATLKHIKWVYVYYFRTGKEKSH